MGMTVSLSGVYVVIDDPTPSSPSTATRSA
jgi:hypothetical protein